MPLGRNPGASGCNIGAFGEVFAEDQMVSRPASIILGGRLAAVVDPRKRSPR